MILTTKIVHFLIVNIYRFLIIWYILNVILYSIQLIQYILHTTKLINKYYIII